MSNHFLELWRFFLSRPHVRSWLCDPVLIPPQYAVAHARQPPLPFTDTATASYTLFVLGHDESVALGALHLSNKGFTYRTAITHFPSLENHFIASFGWTQNGTLEVRFGRAEYGQIAAHGMQCRWTHIRVYDAIAARTVSHTAGLGDAALADAVAAPHEAFRDIDVVPASTLMSLQLLHSSPLSSAGLSSASNLCHPSPGQQIPVEHAPHNPAEQELYKGNVVTNPISLFDAPDLLPAPATSEPAQIGSSVSAAAAAQISAADAADSIFVDGDVEPFPGDSDPVPCIVDSKLETTPVSVKLPPFVHTHGTARTKRDSDPISTPVAHPGNAPRLPASGGVEKERRSNKKKKRHEPQTLECPICHALIRGKRGNLNRHIAARHERMRAFACAMPGCNLAFQSKLNLVRHMTRVHEGRPHKCAQCPRGFRTAATLSKHIGAAHKAPKKAFVCAKCAVCFGRRSVLENHVERVHGAGKGLGSAGCAMFGCPAPGCGKRFSSWGEQREHETEMHQGKVHQCTLCSAVFDHEEMLSKHIRRDHGQTKTSRNCPVCGCVYSQRSNLLRHISLAHKDYMPECKL